MNGTEKLIAPLLGDWYLAEAFELNTNLLDTNLINLAVVIGVLLYFGRGVLSTLLSKRRQDILSTIRSAEERYRSAVDRVSSAKALLEQMRERVNQMHVDNLSQIEREREELSQASDDELRRLEHSTAAVIQFEEQNMLEQLRQKTYKQALDRALQALKHRLDNDLHTRIMDYNIALFATVDSPIH